MDEATYSLPRRLPAHCLHWTSHPSFHSRQFCSGHAYVLVFCWHPELLRFAHASGPRSGATSVCHKSAGLSISSFSLARNHIPGSVFFRIQAFAEATTTIKQLSSRMLRGCRIFQETLGNRCRRQVQAKGALMDYQLIKKPRCRWQNGRQPLESPDEVVNTILNGGKPSIP